MSRTDDLRDLTRQALRADLLKCITSAYGEVGAVAVVAVLMVQVDAYLDAVEGGWREAGKEMPERYRLMFVWRHRRHEPDLSWRTGADLWRTNSAVGIREHEINPHDLWMPVPPRPGAAPLPERLSEPAAATGKPADKEQTDVR